MPVIFNRIMNEEAFKTFIAQKLMHNDFRKHQPAGGVTAFFSSLHRKSDSASREEIMVSLTFVSRARSAR